MIVIVNSDEFLIEKKGFYLIPSIERAQKIIKNLKNVESVFLSIDKDDSVSESIRALAADKSFNIKYFANGGDRKNDSDIPEKRIC